MAGYAYDQRGSEAAGLVFLVAGIPIAEDIIEVPERALNTINVTNFFYAEQYQNTLSSQIGQKLANELNQKLVDFPVDEEDHPTIGLISMLRQIGTDLLEREAEGSDLHDALLDWLGSLETAENHFRNAQIESALLPDSRIINDHTNEQLNDLADVENH